MLKLMSPFEIGNFLEDRGWDVFPVKQENGMYKCTVWKFDKSLGLGKIEYKTWKEAVEETSKKIHSKLTE